MLTALGLFTAATAAVLLVGPRMARTADELARLTRMGGALFGAVFLALATGLPEIGLTPSASLAGAPKIAVGGLLGAAVAQLGLIAVVDLVLWRGSFYRRLLRREAVSYCVLLLAVLALAVAGSAVEMSLGRVGVAALVLPVAYLAGLSLLARREILAAPQPAEDQETASDATAAVNAREGRLQQRAWIRFAVFALALAAAGVGLERSTATIGEHIGLSQTAAGALLAGLATPLPELVTAVAAARSGAFSLAFGDLVGSSALNVVLLSWADVFYADGSVFALLGGTEIALLAAAMAMAGLALIAVVRRPRRDQVRVAAASPLILAVYAVVVVVLLA